FYSSPLITTTSQAQAAATALLQKSLGLTEQVRFDAIVNAAHDAGDVVAIRRGRAAIDARYVLESFTLPMTHAGALSAVTRKRAT
ncbi:MAG: hypothetical protein LC640_09360, partial [Frankia sp.]|nr:hypothetical protein [Frankia sp.]